MMSELHKIREKHYRQSKSARAKRPLQDRRFFAQRLRAESRVVHVDSHTVLREFERLPESLSTTLIDGKKR